MWQSVTDCLSLLHEFTVHSQLHQIFVKMGPQKIQRKTIMGDGKSTISIRKHYNKIERLVSEPNLQFKIVKD